MFVYQNGKLYIQNGDKIVGVECYPDFIKKVNGSETKQSEDALILTNSEMMAKFNIMDAPYIFPQEKKEEKKEVIKDATSKAKKPTGKSK